MTIDEHADFKLPVVSGTLECSNANFERACLVHIERLQRGIGEYDGWMLATFCDAVRMVREYNKYVTDSVELANLLSENENFREIIKDMDGLMQSAKKEIEELKAENEALKETLNDATDMFSNIQKENEELKAKVKRMIERERQASGW